MLYRSRDGRFYIEKQEGKQYKTRRGHVIYTMEYPNDKTAIEATKKAYQADQRKKRKALH